jgi:hypothetical protein
MRDKSSGKSRGFAFVTFQEPSRDAANQLSKRLLNSSQPHMIQNRIIDVRESDGSKPPDSFLDKQGGGGSGGGSGSSGGQGGRDNNRNGGGNRGGSGKDNRGDGGRNGGGQKHGGDKRDNRGGNDRDNKSGKYGQQSSNQSSGNFGMRGMNPEDNRR